MTGNREELRWQGPFRRVAVELFERPEMRLSPDLLAPRRSWMGWLALIAGVLALSLRWMMR